MKTEQRHDLVKDIEVFGVSLSLLISRANEKSVTMPSGLSREQRRAWAAEQARKIHREAADASASWGMFQIMGFNFAACGEKSVESFVAAMCESERKQLILSGRFIRQGGMLPALQNRNWVDFAKRYNGPAYAQNKYDEKLAKAYAKYAK